MNGLTPNTSLAIMQASQEGFTQRAGNTKNAKDLEKVTAAAREFEAVFISEMMKPMFEGLSTDAPFGGGKGEEVFRGLLVQEYGKLIAGTGSIGMTGQIRDQMIKMQEEADHASQTASK